MIPTFDLANALLGGAPEGAGAGHRYWRINSIDTGGNFLEISELQLLEDSVDVTSGATKTVNAGPDFATLGAIYDGNLTTRNIWGLVTNPATVVLHFDFGAGNEKHINGVKQAGFDTDGRHMHGFTLQWSDDNSAWTTLGSKAGLAYPGNNTLSAEYTFP